MRRSITFVLILLLALTTVLSAQSEMDQEAAKLYNEGNKLYKSGQYEGAIAKYDEAIVIAPHENIYYQKSVSLKKTRDFKAAETALLKGLEINPNFLNAYSGLGTTYYQLKDYNKAIESFGKFIELSSDEKQNKKIQKYIGLAYTQLGQRAKADNKYVAAISNLNEAVKNYNYDAAYLTLAEIHVETGKFNEAISAADNVVKYRSSKSKISKGAAYYYKGLAYKGLEDKLKAKENFEVSVKDKKYKANSKYELDLLK